tara:strand:- start:34 stop:300 length:267 start_codon:yes stop_codon:yes gene_type:complete
MMGVRAFKKASLKTSAMQRILNIISVLSFVLVTSLTAGTAFGYFWITNKENQDKLKQQLVQQVTKAIKLPELSSPALPTAKPTSLPKF